MRPRVIYVDVDETICNTDSSREYSKSRPIVKNIEKINKLYNEGNTIVYWTARGSRKQMDWYDLTYSQLEEWGAKFHELRVDKPYYDLFIDDKSLQIQEL